MATVFQARWTIYPCKACPARRWRNHNGRARIDYAKASTAREAFIPNPNLKLLDQVSKVMHLKHYSNRTETTYLEWNKRFIFCQADNRRSSRSLIDHAIFHHETHLAKRFNFLRRIASHRDEIRQQGRADAAELVFHAEDL